VIFNRNDKTPEANPTEKTTMPDVNTSTTPAYPATPAKSVATAQPLSGLSTTQDSTSVISKALKITGQLESTENVRIEGEIDGDIRAVNVKVGGNAKVKGNVYGDEVEVAGTVEGKIEAKKVVLTRTAHMSGDVIHQDIMIESGAFIDGHCRPEFGKSQSKNGSLAYKPPSAPRETTAMAAAEKVNGAGAKA
jgi:cytoskeletal protein CcmA (bactofilin family)